MNQQTLLKLVRKNLKKYIDVEYRDGERKFFKEPVKNYGVRMPNRRKVAQELYKQTINLTKDELFKVCEKLLASGYSEEATVAIAWVYKRKKEFEKKDFEIFKRWVKKYLDNWAKIDDFCTHSLGFLIDQYPELSKQMIEWAKSKNRWVKRAAAVTYIYPVNKPKPISWILRTAKALLMDPDDMVQKGYGWMLKEASKHHQKQVFELVYKNKDKMPRTALRYAIELMPKTLKAKAMEK